MSNPIELRRQADEKFKAAKALHETAKSADRVLSDDESASFDTLMVAGKDLVARAEKIEADEKRRADVDGMLSSMDAAPIRSNPSDAGADVSVREPEWLSDPALGFSRPRDFYMAILNANITHGKNFPPNLKHLSKDGLIAREKRVQELRDQGLPINAAAGTDEHSRFADPYGGFFIPEAIAPGFKSMMSEGDVIGRYTGRLPMTASRVKLNARVDKTHTTSVTGGLIAYRRGEADTSAATRMETEQVAYDANPMFLKAFATNELLRDSPISFAAILEAGARDAFVDRKNRERVAGTGGAQYVGILNEDAKVQVSAEVGQVAATFVYENAVKMKARLWTTDGSRPVWLMNRTVYPQLPFMNVSVGTGGSAVFVPSPGDDIPDRLLGIPIAYTEYCKALGTVGDVILFNGSEYLEGLWQPLTGVSSVHVRFEQNETCFKWMEENCARLWWRSVLTPINGDTLAPIVTLATRS
jgi:HK97 family phage major capsid protein